MDGSSFWFLSLLVLSVLMWWIGLGIARYRRDAAEALIVCCLIGLAVWAWLMHHPSVTQHLIPTRWLANLEGVGSVPIFMLLVGAAYGRSQKWHEGGVTALASVLGVVYLFYGGWWMLQSTPVQAFGGQSRSPIVLQTYDYSCVPAACTTTLRLLGVETSESEMAALTRTRPGSGATLVRAADAMSRKLQDQADVVIVEIPYEQLAGVTMPALTPLRFESTRYHMVTLLRANEKGVWLMDPVDGLVYMREPVFRAVYQQQLLVIKPPASHLTRLARVQIDRMLLVLAGVPRQGLALSESF